MAEWQKRERVSDWWARGLGLLGLLVAGSGLFWQWWVHEDSLKELVLTRVTMKRTWKGEKMEPIGILQIEVVNMGQHPIFVKKVAAGIREGSEPFTIPATPTKPALQDESLALEPAKNGYYWISDWDLVRHPLSSSQDPHKWESFSVSVETTKGIYIERDQPVILSDMIVFDIGSTPLLNHSPSQ